MPGSEIVVAMLEKFLSDRAEGFCLSGRNTYSIHGCNEPLRSIANPDQTALDF